MLLHSDVLCLADARNLLAIYFYGVEDNVEGVLVLFQNNLYTEISKTFHQLCMWCTTFTTVIIGLPVTSSALKLPTFTVILVYFLYYLLMINN